MDKNQGYEIIQAVMLENGRGFALGHNPAAPSPYVTWACYDDKDGQRQYEWGHYGSDRAALEQDFAARVQEYQRLYNVDVRQVEAPGLYKYYSTQRPVDIGTPSRPVTPRMRSSTTISAPRLKMDHFWRGGIWPTRGH